MLTLDNIVVELRPVNTALGMRWSAYNEHGTLLDGLHWLEPKGEHRVVQDQRGRHWRVDSRGYMNQYMGDIPVMTPAEYRMGRKERIKKLMGRDKA
jgi:hypothetical protein